MAWPRISFLLAFILAFVTVSCSSESTPDVPAPKMPIEIAAKLRAVADFTLDLSDMPGMERYEMKFYGCQFLYLAEAFDNFKLEAVTLYQVIEDISTKIFIEIFDPCLENDAPPYRLESCVDDAECRRVAMARIQFQRDELLTIGKERGDIAEAILLMSFALLDLQASIVDVAHSFDSFLDDFYDCLEHLDLAIDFIDALMDDDVLEAVHTVRDEYFEDNVELARSNLEYHLPCDLSDKAIQFLAENSILSNKYAFGHHLVCQEARMNMFQGCPEGIVAGEYKSKKAAAGIESVGTTFGAHFLYDLEPGLDHIEEECDSILHGMLNAWQKSDLSQKQSLMTLYISITWTQKILKDVNERASRKRGGLQKNEVSMMIQACWFLLMGIQNIATEWFKPLIATLTGRILNTPQVMDDKYHDKMLNLNETFEANFASIRSTCPAFFDLVFRANELSQMISKIISTEVVGVNGVTMDNPHLWKVGMEMFGYSRYLMATMWKLGMLEEPLKVFSLLQQGVTDLSLLSNGVKNMNGISPAVLSFLVEASTWRSLVSWPEMYKMIPKQHTNALSRRNEFSLESILKRFMENEQPALPPTEHAVCETGVTSDTNTASATTTTTSTVVTSETNKESVREKKPKKVSMKPASKKAQRRRRVRQKEREREKKRNSENGNLSDSSEEKEKEKLSNEGKEVTEVLQKDTTCDSGKEKDSADSQESQGDEEVKPEKNAAASLWSNSAVNLFANVSNFEGIPQASPIEEEPEQPAVPPTHFTSIIRVLGYSHVDADPRDIAMGLLLVGQRIWKNYLRPLLDAVESNGLDYLTELFMHSLENFELEIEHLNTFDSELIGTLFNQAGIMDMSFFKNCLKYFHQRINITHPHIPRHTSLRSDILQRHLTTLEFSGRIDESIISNWRKNLKCEEQIVVEGIPEENRPVHLLTIEFTQRALSFIAVHEALPHGSTAVDRNYYAHRNVDDHVFQAYIDYIFDGEVELDFLRSL